METGHNYGTPNTQTQDNKEKLVSALTRPGNRTRDLRGCDTMKIDHGVRQIKLQRHHS